MTENMAKLYKNDVDLFYKRFTGNDAVPETIQKFSDIKLKNYFDTESCQSGKYRQPVSG